MSCDVSFIFCFGELVQVEIPEDLKPDKYPHHMERGEFCTYKSSSILGQIYDEVDAFSKFDPIQG